MAKSLLFVGIDVDDKSFTGAYLSKNGIEKVNFKTKPSAGALAKKLKQIESSGFGIKVCYEATYLGFSLWRDLKKLGIDCTVISPNHIPKVSGKQQKTDRLDAEKLAEYFSNGQLTPIYVPTEQDEAVRSFIRSREDISNQIRNLKKQIIALCRLNSLNYRLDGGLQTKYTSHWTFKHMNWLKQELKKIDLPILKLNFDLLLLNLNQLEEMMSRYDSEIEQLATKTEYIKKIEALKSFRGIETFTAMTLALEIGDVKRFDHPKKLVSYAGFDIREYSSGGKENKFSITKMGNKYIRTRLVEAAQTSFMPPKISRALGKRRQEVDPKVIAIADKCMHRIHKKSFGLLHRSKHRNTIKVACAREMLCFVWEALQSVAA